MFKSLNVLQIFTKIIDKWSLILSQESIAINRMKPSLNHESKASKDLLIFKYQMKYERQICRQYFIVRTCEMKRICEIGVYPIYEILIRNICKKVNIKS